MNVESASVCRGYVPVGRGLMHYRSAGSGETVLLFHQTPSSSASFARVLPVLGRHCRAIALDTPGYGMSDAIAASETSIEGYAEAMLEAMDGLNIGQAYLVGHHTGASIALEIASRWPARVKRLILAGIVSLEDPSEIKEWSKYIIPVTHDVGGKFLETYPLPYLRELIVSEDKEQFVQELVAALQAGEEYWKAYEAIFRYDARARLVNITVPVQILNARDDHYTYESTKRALSRVRDATYREVPGGHQAVFDHPEEFATAVEEFLFA
jgi:pimeloyl-ACP methyl ester carboxylesterase